MRASGEPPTAYGRYENIFLSKDEYDELQQNTRTGWNG